MKKIVIGIGSAVVVLVIAIFILSALEKKVTISTHASVERRMKNQETFVMVFGSKTCEYCKLYREGTLSKYVKIEDDYIPLVYVDISESFGRGALDAFLEEYHFPQFNSTPTTVLVVNGVPRTNIKTGDISLDELKAFVRQAN